MVRFLSLLVAASLFGPAVSAKAQIFDQAESDDEFGRYVVAGDFDGDGIDDVAVGVPREDIGSSHNAGAVHILYGTLSLGLSDPGNGLWTQGVAGPQESPEPNDRFGSALAVGDFDADGFDDLAIGAPSEDAGGIFDAGVVHVLYGSTDGFSFLNDDVWHQDVAGITGIRESFDYFGWALAAGDFDGDGYDDLAIGSRGEGIGDIDNAGYVQILFGASGGLTAFGQQAWDQDDAAGGTGGIEAGDEFGSTLAAGDFDGDGYDDLAIAAPFEDVFSVVNAGLVHVLYGTSAGLSNVGNQQWSQDTSGIQGVAEEGDRFGFALAAGDFDGDEFDDLAVGVPFEEYGIDDEGVVHALYGSGGGLTNAGDQLWTQNSAGVQGTAEFDDFFGYALAVGDFDGNGRDDLAVGAPGEGVTSSGYREGVAHVLYGLSTGLSASGNDYWHQNVGSIKEETDDVDWFGIALAAGDFDGNGRDDLAVGVPFEDVGLAFDAGVLHAIYHSGGGLDDDGNQLWFQGAAAPLAVTLAPIDPPAPVVIARGETGSFSATFIAGPNVPDSFEYWTEADLPNGNVRTLVGPNTLLLDPDQSVTLQFDLRIPNSAPLGDYTHRLEAGTFSNQVLDSDSYGATIVDNSPGREADPTDDAWLIYDSEGRLMESETVLDLRATASSVAWEEVSIAASGTSLLDEAVLRAAYPNPFSQTARVAFDLPAAQHVRIAVYDVLGREVAVLHDGSAEAGRHDVVFDASGLPSGVYLARLEAGGTVQTRRVTLVR